MKHLVRLALCSGLLAGTVQAAPLFVSFDNFNYAGTVTKYATLADAQAGVKATAMATIATATNGDRRTLQDARDGNLYAARGASTPYGQSDIAYFSTAWYFTTFVNQVNGWGNPNNSNNGFIQYYDTTSTPTVTGGWSNANKRFTVDIVGGDGDSGNFARLWDAPSTGGAAGNTAGRFIQFALNMTLDFGSAASLNALTGWYELDAAPTTVTGGVQGIFQNDSTSNPSSNGFYVFDFSFAPGSWAAANDATWALNANTRYGPENFFAAPSSAPVPLPGTLALALLGLGLLSVRRQRR